MSLGMQLQSAFAGCPDLGSALDVILQRFEAISGTVHALDSDGLLHLTASRNIPDAVLEKVRTVPVGTGMAGLAVERRQEVNVCNLQTDTSGDVRPGAKASGLQGAVALPIFHEDAVVGALGVGAANERIFTETELEELTEIGRVLAARFLTSSRSSAA